MNTLFLSGFAMFTAIAGFGQSRVNINQTGGTGNNASVTQSGAGNSVSISQTGGATTDSSKPGNRVSLRVPHGSQTTIDQRNAGPNWVEISQEGQATATISQSSETGENSIHTLPRIPDSHSRTRPSKRHNRR